MEDACDFDINDGHDDTDVDAEGGSDFATSDDGRQMCVKEAY